jgi:MFS family permease
MHVPAARTTMTSVAKKVAGGAVAFVLIMGVVNLFSDTTYEGASSINGPFLKTLGASAAIIGIMSGIGEFLGYSLRSVSGYVSDKSGRYWLVTFVGYIINLLAVPALALAGNWPLAALLIVLERVGRAIRKPSVEAMLSYTTGSLGKGWVYGLNTALDQTGATVGPLIMALVLQRGGSYHGAYVLLLIPALLALSTLTVARFTFPRPSRLEQKSAATQTGFTRSYWLYTAGGACFAAGLVSFELISFHFASTKTVDNQWIPMFFAIAMATDALVSPVLGWLFDKTGFVALVGAVILSALFAPFIFLGNFAVALIGMILWGIGFGAQDTLLKAIIVTVLPEGRRNTAFGLFYIGYGLGWLIGSVTTGLLYDRSIPILIGFSIVIQLASLPFFLFGRRLAP